MTGSPYDWHVSAAREGMGSRGRFVYYVQRYTRPEDPRRFTGDVSTRTWSDDLEAQRAADEANAGRCTFETRGTYL